MGLRFEAQRCLENPGRFRVNKLNDKTWVDNAQVQATDFVSNGLNKITSKDFKGTPAEAAEEVMAQYQLMSHSRVMPEAAKKGALTDVITRMAGSGNQALLGAFLDQEMDGVGSVRGFIGESKAITLTNHAGTVFDGKERSRIDDEMPIRWFPREFAECRIHLSVRFYFSVFGMPNTEKVSNGSISGVFCLMGP